MDRDIDCARRSVDTVFQGRENRDEAIRAIFDSATGRGQGRIAFTRLMKIADEWRACGNFPDELRDTPEYSAQLAERGK